MQRLTNVDGTKYRLDLKLLTVQENDVTGVPIDRLAAFENFHQDLANNQLVLANQLEELRNRGKKNSVQFRELLGKKMIESNTLLILKLYGIE